MAKREKYGVFQSQLQIHLRRNAWMGIGRSYTEWVNADDFELRDAYSDPIAVVACQIHYGDLKKQDCMHNLGYQMGNKRSKEFFG